MDIILNLIMKVGNIDNRKKPKSMLQTVNIISGFSQDCALIDSILPCEFKNSKKTKTTKNADAKAIVCKILYNYFNNASKDNLPTKRNDKCSQLRSKMV